MSDYPFEFQVVSSTEDLGCEVVLVNSTASIAQLALIAKLIGPEAVLDGDLSRLWDCLVLCSPEFSTYHRAQLAPQRPDAHSIFLCTIEETSHV